MAKLRRLKEMKGVKYTKNEKSLPLTVLKTPKMRILKAIDM